MGQKKAEKIQRKLSKLHKKSEFLRDKDNAIQTKIIKNEAALKYHLVDDKNEIISEVEYDLVEKKGKKSKNQTQPA